MLTRASTQEARSRQAMRALTDLQRAEVVGLAALRRDGWQIEDTSGGWIARPPTTGERIAAEVEALAREYLAKFGNHS